MPSVVTKVRLLNIKIQITSKLLTHYECLVVDGCDVQDGIWHLSNQICNLKLKAYQNLSPSRNSQIVLDVIRKEGTEISCFSIGQIIVQLGLG